MSIQPDSAYLLVRSGGEPVAAGLAVADAPWTGLFDLATAPSARRRGFGTALLRQLLVWGAERGAPEAYLQVVSGNGPAEALYAREGFRETYGYAYRVSTEDSPWRDPKAP
jgi:ribosomal protein S18 acetylase RimI-like enzyme